MGDVTWEIAIHFSPEPTAPATKRHVLRWLAARGVTAVVEAFIDGIETPLTAARAVDCAAPRVLDVGTGNGVRALAALKLGAAHAIATEIDDEALLEARRNMAHNGVDTTALELRCSADVPHGPFDVVVANILAPVLVVL